MRTYDTHAHTTHMHIQRTYLRLCICSSFLLIRQEIIQRKNELDEKKRLEIIAEKDMLGKDKLRQLEEYRMIDEERKKREFADREQHRLEVEKKKREAKEKERCVSCIF